ncbi:hypothetical protein G6M89_12285 [Natronolimnobius sp. AArcel1]|uniref:hypothetical protein n=1 Tax=Natronolimnobius sp. AArcel1 TaxID=1679093 RepID=UPI0013E9D459|nr:hypothetical protein [Natronolimnobius sp. AArcel1]NGM69775.1 hypothetical protein [Natronolimnobius sp. AArcel1]
MKATIVGENEEGVGVDVVDNDGETIEISISKENNEIVYQQSDYPDKPAERTSEENLNVAQAREFAKYHAYRERGIETIPAYDDISHIDAVRRAICDLSDEEFEQHFGETYQQLLSHHRDDVEPPVELPEEVAESSPILYEQDVYLGFDPVPTEPENPLSAEIASKVRDLLETYSTDPYADVSESGLAHWEEFTDVVDDLIQDEVIDYADSLTVASVSDLHVVYPDNGLTAVEHGAQPFDREPNARLELVRLEFDSINTFQEYLDFHLRCQIRDRYIMIGVMPPEPFQVLGFGKLEAAIQYDFLDGYPKFHDSAATPDASLFEGLDRRQSR